MSSAPQKADAEVVRGTFVRPGIFYPQLERGMQPHDLFELLARIVQYDQAQAVECGSDVAAPALPKAVDPSGSGGVQGFINSGEQPWKGPFTAACCPVRPGAGRAL